jgi:hypothetical protein
MHSYAVITEVCTLSAPSLAQRPRNRAVSLKAKISAQRIAVSAMTTARPQVRFPGTW